MEMIKTLKDLEKLRKSILAEQKPGQPLVTVCGGTGCLSNGSEQVAAAFAEEMKKQGLDGKVVLKLTGCHGFCERGPLVTIHPQEIFYQRVCGEGYGGNRGRDLGEGKTVDRLLYDDPQTQKRSPATMKSLSTNTRCASPFGTTGGSTPPISGSTSPTAVMPPWVKP